MGRTPLFFGAYDPDFEKIKILIGAGADVNAVDNNGNTVLHNLARRIDGNSNRIKSVKLFLKSGCFINRKNDMGRNALAEHISVKKYNADDPKMRELLFAAGETFDGRIPEGYEALPEDQRDVSLKAKCRKLLRRHVLKLNTNLNLFSGISQLPLPKSLRNYLSYDILIDDESENKCGKRQMMLNLP